MSNPTTRCPLCARTATLQYRGHPGYQEPARFDIYLCPACDSKFAQPLESSAAVYDLIYRNIDHVRGYARYARYARGVLHHAAPLAYLAEEEDSYWAVARYLEQRGSAAAPRIVEVGSGFGYLTYALSRSGYDVRGLDISGVAVANARKRFGDLYDCGDLFALGPQRADAYDAVIMTEVIEHIPNLVDLLRAAFALVRPGGDVVVTTPNKSASPPHVLWDTDSPPVHLWWLSERSMSVLAERLGANLRFIDFTEFNRTHALEIASGAEMAKPTSIPVFDAKGEMRSRNWLKAALRRVLYGAGYGRVRLAMLRRRAQAQTPSSRRQTLCAVFGKPG